MNRRSIRLSWWKNSANYWNSGLITDFINYFCYCYQTCIFLTNCKLITKDKRYLSPYLIMASALGIAIDIDYSSWWQHLTVFQNLQYKPCSSHWRWCRTGPYSRWSEWPRWSICRNKWGRTYSLEILLAFNSNYTLNIFII